MSVNLSSQDPLDAARHVLRTVFGYDDFRGAQAPIIQEMLAGRNALDRKSVV